MTAIFNLRFTQPRRDFLKAGAGLTLGVFLAPKVFAQEDFVTDVKLEGNARIVTFANGMTAKELIVDVGDAARRLVWSVVEGRPTHHNGSIQIFPEGDGCRLVWIADILPHELKGPIGTMMQHGMDAMKKKLESA